jgi:hypothetical protein
MKLVLLLLARHAHMTGEEHIVSAETKHSHCNLTMNKTDWLLNSVFTFTE